MAPILPSPFDIIRILIEEAIRAAIEETRRRNEQQNGFLSLNCAMTSNCELPGRVMGLKSFNKEAMSTEEAVSKLLDGIPPEYADQLQNPEELVKRLNIDVPPEFVEDEGLLCQFLFLWLMNQLLICFNCKPVSCTNLALSSS
ncbi:hypothetical protein RHMOL_Rhmol01G0042100 [Rhododendron molle]|uniref:Uncharacterized protein n=1 Tax=Rhododendron molle TaxID=49168 RepID=A0ACC0Q0M0_RHOML|nr:hypothetical protein RHMOL_Rhmol01G0042100 [Rhododendron molle]